MGTVVNALAVLFGVLLGSTIIRGISDPMRATMIKALALAVGLVGVQLSLKTTDTVVAIVALVLGGSLGTLIGLERRIDWLRARTSRDAGRNRGPLIASLLFLVGPMAVLGSLADGLRHDPSLLYVKAVLDGVTAVVLSGTYGPRVAWAIVPLIIYQGGIYVLAHVISPALGAALLNEFSGVGGLLVLAMAINMLDLASIPVMDMLPALPLAVLLVAARQALGLGT